MTNIITHQQEVALRILHKLECADPYAILAGGAPRDWHFGDVANDLDFYVHLPPATCSFESLRFKRLGLCLSRIDWNDERSEEYKCMEHLSRIYEGVEDGFKFQIMVMREPTFKSVIPKFGASVCMVWWKGSKVKTTYEFELSHIFKTIFKKDDYTAKEKHITKMQSRYPDYNVDNFSSIEKYIKGYSKSNNIFPTPYNVIQHWNKVNHVNTTKY